MLGHPQPVVDVSVGAVVGVPDGERGPVGKDDRLGVLAVVEGRSGRGHHDRRGPGGGPGGCGGQAARGRARRRAPRRAGDGSSLHLELPSGRGGVGEAELHGPHVDGVLARLELPRLDLERRRAGLPRDGPLARGRPGAVLLLAGLVDPALVGRAGRSGEREVPFFGLTRFGPLIGRLGAAGSWSRRTSTPRRRCRTRPTSSARLPPGAGEGELRGAVVSAGVAHRRRRLPRAAGGRTLAWTTSSKVVGALQTT